MDITVINSTETIDAESKKQHTVALFFDHTTGVNFG